MMPLKNIRWAVLAVLVVAALTLAACGSSSKTAAVNSNQAAPGTYTTVNVRQAHDALSANPDAIIVDVRTPQEWATTGVPTGAVLITLDQIAQRAPGALSQDRPVYLICNSGNRSRVAADALVKLGFKSVYNVDGGIQAWMRASLPTEPYAP